jgi:hypothetical protein
MGKYFDVNSQKKEDEEEKDEEEEEEVVGFLLCYRNFADW